MVAFQLPLPDPGCMLFLNGIPRGGRRRCSLMKSFPHAHNTCDNTAAPRSWTVRQVGGAVARYAPMGRKSDAQDERRRCRRDGVGQSGITERRSQLGSYPDGSLRCAEHHRCRGGDQIGAYCRCCRGLPNGGIVRTAIVLCRATDLCLKRTLGGRFRLLSRMVMGTRGAGRGAQHGTHGRRQRQGGENRQQDHRDAMP